MRCPAAANTHKCVHLVADDHTAVTGNDEPLETESLFSWPLLSSTGPD